MAILLGASFCAYLATSAYILMLQYHAGITLAAVIFRIFQISCLPIMLSMIYEFLSSGVEKCIDSHELRNVIKFLIFLIFLYASVANLHYIHNLVVESKIASLIAR